VCIPQVYYLKGVYIMCWILIGPMSNQPAMFPLPHGFLGKSFPYLGIFKTLKRGGREEREMGYGRPFLTRPSLNEICTDYFLMMAHPLPPITHFHSNSEVTHMLLARHSLSLVCANSQRDFFTNCISRFLHYNVRFIPHNWYLKLTCNPCSILYNDMDEQKSLKWSHTSFMTWVQVVTSAKLW
jgi:hypothetical protein